MTTARNNRRRKAKATKRLSAWRRNNRWAWSAGGPALDQLASLYGTRRKRSPYECDKRLRRRLVRLVCDPPDRFKWCQRPPVDLSPPPLTQEALADEMSAYSKQVEDYVAPSSLASAFLDNHRRSTR